MVVFCRFYIKDRAQRFLNFRHFSQFSSFWAFTYFVFGRMRFDFLQHASCRRHHPRSHREVGEVFGYQFIIVGYHPSPVHHKIGRFHRIFDGS